MIPAAARVPLLALCFVPFSGGPAPGAAQGVAGEVVDAGRAPVADVRIDVFDARGRHVADAVSNDEGRFTVDAPRAGMYRLHVVHPGYRSISGGPFQLNEGEILQVLVVIHPDVIELEGVQVQVTGRSAHLASRGFYDREAMGGGYFFDEREVQDSGVRHLAELLGRLPSLRAPTAASIPFGPDAVRNPPLYYDRGSQPCVPALWVDGMLLRSGGVYAEPLRPDDWVSPEEVAGIEFYGGPASAPLEFGHSASCAVLLIWTRRS